MKTFKARTILSVIAVGSLTALNFTAGCGGDSSIFGGNVTESSSSTASTSTNAGGGGASAHGGGGSASTSTASSQGGAGGAGGGTGGSVECPHVDGHDPATAGDPTCSTDCGMHCVAEDSIANSLRSNFATCSDKGGGAGLCVPDEQIMGGSDFMTADCTAHIGGAGKCVTKCVKSVTDDPNHGLLAQDGCANAEDVCVPCINPLTSMPTGACAPVTCSGSGAGGGGGSGAGGGPMCPHMGPPVIDPNMFGPCAPACGGAHCVPESAVPPAQQSLVAACTPTTGGNGFCVPDTVIAAGGEIKPKTCTAFTGTTAEGRCLSKCIKNVADQASQLHQDVCEADELCTPCFDPTTGVATGACSLSDCDAPVTTTPFKFAECCPADPADPTTMEHDLCVPSDIIPAAQASSLAAQTCDSGFLCVPHEYLPGNESQVKTCVAALGGAGTCVSKCTTAPQLFGQGTCDDNHMCVSCALAGSPKPPGCP